MTAETAPNTSQGYLFSLTEPTPPPPHPRSGTFLYQSGSHPAVQVQMGLYGAMTKDESAGNAYAGVAYAHETVLLYSEIDQALHAAVSAGTYGTDAGPTSTIDYRPSLFLINGQSYTTDSVATIAAGTANELSLLRMLNAGLHTHAPVLENGRLSIVAEDGNKLPYALDQAGVMLAAGKTHDAVWTPLATGLYSLYDRMLSLNAPGQGSAGMLAKLSVGVDERPRLERECQQRQLQHGPGCGPRRRAERRPQQRHRGAHGGSRRLLADPRNDLRMGQQRRLHVHARSELLRGRFIHLCREPRRQHQSAGDGGHCRPTGPAAANRTGAAGRRQRYRERRHHPRGQRSERRPPVVLHQVEAESDRWFFDAAGHVELHRSEFEGRNAIGRRGSAHRPRHRQGDPEWRCSL